ncbi:FG-GAP repeat protein [uncultured Friedmanniella sp.]|uniref:FG-GAP repeat protein n=1 Tax=uncultured Friedmanniella sp. TaxID=335381 RepID=UPI0035CACA04
MAVTPRLAAALLLVAATLVPPATHPDVAAAVARNCQATHACTDLNGDGFDDAVIGNPYASVNGRAQAGTVTVLFGDADGRIGEGVRRTITQADGGSRPETGDHFGWSVSVNSLGLDGRLAIMVGSPDEDAPGAVDAGIVQVFRFLPDAEGGPGRVVGSTVTQAGARGVVEAGDQFGYSVALGDNYSDDNGYSFAGAPGEDVDGVVDAGVVNGFQANDATEIPELPGRSEMAQGTGSMPGVPRPGDRFGSTLVIADLARNPFVPWVLIGAPGDEVDGHPGAGSVTVISEEDAVAPNSSTPEVPTQVVTQDAPGVSDEAEDGDGFGTSIAIGNPSTPGPYGYAIGAPGEDVGSVRDAGSVTLFDSDDLTLHAVGSLTQDAPGWGRAEAGDHFGASVAIRAVDDALLVGVPGENFGSVADGGAISIANGPVTDLTHFRTLTLSSAGIPGNARSKDRFGASVGGQTGVRENILAAGVPRKSGGSVIVFSSRDIPVRAWTAGKGGIPATTRFGAVVRGLETA